MADARLVVSIFDIFSPVRLSMSVNGSKAIGYYPAGDVLNFVFDARIRFLVPKQTLEATGVFLSLANPSGQVFLYKQKTVKESSYIFTFPVQSELSSDKGAYKASVHVWRQLDGTYNLDVNYITEPFVAFILE